METLDPTAGFVMDDDLLNFSLDDEDDDDEKTKLSSSSLSSLNPDTDDHSRSFPEFVEEELEWLSNKDAFPAVETCLDILPRNPCPVNVLKHLNHKSPVSVLENRTITSNAITSCCGSFQVPARCPARARSKRKRKQIGPQWGNQVNIKNPKQEQASPLPLPPPRPQRSSGGGLGRRCQHCLAEKTPQWRAGPMGPKTLCNACGVRYKSGRLVPEYRPASSPTFSSELHSNSHRKIIEMRKQNQTGEITAKGYRVG